MHMSFNEWLAVGVIAGVVAYLLWLWWFMLRTPEPDKSKLPEDPPYPPWGV